MDIVCLKFYYEQLYKSWCLNKTIGEGGWGQWTWKVWVRFRIDFHLLKRDKPIVLDLPGDSQMAEVQREKRLDSLLRVSASVLPTSCKSSRNSTSSPLPPLSFLTQRISSAMQNMNSLHSTTSTQRNRDSSQDEKRGLMDFF